MPNTITQFFTFTAGTPARSSQVDTNFSNFRGDLIPVFPNSQGSSDLAHDLGQADHRWVDLWVDRIFMAGNTTAGSSIDSTTTGISVRVGDTTSAIFTTIGMERIGLGPRVVIADNSGTTANAIFRKDIDSSSTNAAYQIAVFQFVPKGSAYCVGVVCQDGGLASPGLSGGAMNLFGTTTSALLTSFLMIELNGATVSANQYVIQSSTSTGTDIEPIELNAAMFMNFGANPGVTNTVALQWKPTGANIVRLDTTSIRVVLWEP